MADATGGPVHRYEGTGIKWTSSPKSVRLIQWVNDAGDINNTNADLVVVVDGTTLTFKIDKHNTDASVDENDVVAWQAGPFNPGLVINNFSITTMDAGQIHVWIS